MLLTALGSCLSHPFAVGQEAKAVYFFCFVSKMKNRTGILLTRAEMILLLSLQVSDKAVNL